MELDCKTGVHAVQGNMLAIEYSTYRGEQALKVIGIAVLVLAVVVVVAVAASQSSNNSSGGGGGGHHHHHHHHGGDFFYIGGWGGGRRRRQHSVAASSTILYGNYSNAHPNASHNQAAGVVIRQAQGFDSRDEFFKCVREAHTRSCSPLVLARMCAHVWAWAWAWVWSTVPARTSGVLPGPCYPLSPAAPAVPRLPACMARRYFFFNVNQYADLAGHADLVIPRRPRWPRRPPKAAGAARRRQRLPCGRIAKQTVPRAACPCLVIQGTS